MPFRRSAIAPAEVHRVLGEHILTDGFPHVGDLEKSHGAWLVDAVSGRELLDFYSDFASNPVGFNHPAMLEPGMQARLARAATYRVANSDKYTSFYAEFVDTLARTAGVPELPNYFFIDGGALAVENALKAAFDWKVRKNKAAGRGERGTKVLHLEGAFHGRSGYTMSLTNSDPKKTDHYPKFDWPRLPNPRMTFPFTGENVSGTEDLEHRCFAAADAAFAREPHDIAAIILEPIQGEGGDNHFRTRVFEKLRALADAHDALLVYDEVQAGLGVTGKWWAHQHHGVLPDILCFAKKMQVGGIMVSNRIHEVEDNVFKQAGRLNSTWGGSLVDMVRCTRLLEIMVEEKLVENAAARGEELLAGLVALSARFPFVTNVRGKGLMCAIDLPDPVVRDAVRMACYEHGFIVLASGRRAIRFRPPLSIDSEVVGEALTRLGRALESVRGSWPSPRPPP